jgi:hypothetical protein
MELPCGGFSRAIEITMRPNVQRLIERNVICHVCNNLQYQSYSHSDAIFIIFQKTIFDKTRFSFPSFHNFAGNVLPSNWHCHIRPQIFLLAIYAMQYIPIKFKNK